MICTLELSMHSALESNLPFYCLVTINNYCPKYTDMNRMLQVNPIRPF